MANPRPYVPGFDYSNFEAANPTKPKPGNQLDNDFNNIKATTDDLIAGLGNIRRSDGALNNGIVTVDSLADDIADQIIDEVDERVLEAVAEAEASAAASAQSAFESAVSAADSENAAVLAGDRADLAMNWAVKTDGPVAGGEYSSKYWAQQAALYAGLQVVQPADIPTTDEGPIFVPGQGPMAWDSVDARYVVTNGVHGQCRFVFVSATECRLMPLDGNGLVVNGRQFRIPEAGVPITTAATLANGRYYVYALATGANLLALELSATPYAVHRDGRVIKTGDPTRTLVGWVGTNAGNQFQDSAASARMVASWFNRRPRSVIEQVNGTTASATMVGHGNGRALFNWAGEEVAAALSGYGNLSTNNYYTMEIRAGGATPAFVPGVAAGRNAGGPASISSTGPAITTADGVPIYQIFGQVNTGTVTTSVRMVCTTNI